MTAPRRLEAYSCRARRPCPLHCGEGSNFAVKPQTGEWYCHSKCRQGGDIVDLEMRFGASALNLRAAGIEECTAMAISGPRTRAVFDRYGIQPEAKLHEAMKKLETKIRTKDGQSEAQRPADQAAN